MLLSEGFKSSIHHGKPPMQCLQLGCLSLAAVGGNSREKMQLSHEGLNWPVHQKYLKIFLKNAFGF